MKDKHQIAPYPLRLPPNMRAALALAATANHRSLHSEILMRLENAVKADQRSMLQAGQQ